MGQKYGLMIVFSGGDGNLSCMNKNPVFEEHIDNKSGVYYDTIVTGEVAKRRHICKSFCLMFKRLSMHIMLLLISFITILSAEVPSLSLTTINEYSERIMYWMKYCNGNYLAHDVKPDNDKWIMKIDSTGFVGSWLCTPFNRFTQFSSIKEIFASSGPIFESLIEPD